MQDIDEVNMFKDDNTVIHFKKPSSNIFLLILLVQFSVRENLLVVTGNPETKELKTMFQDVLKQMGPK